MCPLCDLELLTTLYYRDSVIAIVDCTHCLCPMVVFRAHQEPSGELWAHARGVATALFPDRRHRLRRGSIPDHPHFHLEWRS